MNKNQCFYCGEVTENQHEYGHFKTLFCNTDHQLKWHYKMAEPLLISGNPGSFSSTRPVVVLNQSNEFDSFPKLSKNIFHFLKERLIEYEWILGNGDGQIYLYLGITSTVRIAKEIALRKSYENYLNKVTSIGQNPVVLAARAGENNGVLLRGMGSADPVYPLDYDTMHSVLENASNDEIVELLRKRMATIRLNKIVSVSETRQIVKKNNNSNNKKSVVIFLSNDLAKYLTKLKSNLFAYLRENLSGIEWSEYHSESSDLKNSKLVFVTTLSTPRVQKEITSKSDFLEYEKLTNNQIIIALVIGSEDAEPFNLSTGSYGKIYQLMYNVDHDIHQSRNNRETLGELESRFI